MTTKTALPVQQRTPNRARGRDYILPTCVALACAGAAFAGADTTFDPALTKFTDFLEGSGGKIITVLSLAGGLIEAMASDAVLPGFTARAELSAPRRTGGIEVQLVAEYQGDELTGQRFLVRNLGQENLALGSEREGPAGALAFAYGRDALAPGEATSAFLVFAKGGLD